MSKTELKLDPKAKTQKLLAEFKAERAVIENKVAPLRSQRDSLRASIRATEAKIYELTQQIKVVQGEDLYDLDMAIARLTRSLPDTKVLHAEGLSTESLSAG